MRFLLAILASLALLTASAAQQAPQLTQNPNAPIYGGAPAIPIPPLLIGPGGAAGYTDSRITGAQQAGSVTPVGGPTLSVASALSGAVTVPTNAALQAISITGVVPGYPVRRSGFAYNADGGDQLYTFSTSACSLNAGAGDNGTQVAPNSGTGCWISSIGPMSALAWGADPGGTNDSTTALNYAFNQNSSRKVTIPCGNYRVDGTITVAAVDFVEGAGTACARLFSTSATADLLHINKGVQGFRISDIYLDRTTTPTAGAGAFVDADAGSSATYGTLDRVWSVNQWNGFRLGPSPRAYCYQCQAQNNYNDGFSFFNYSTDINNQWILTHPLSQQNNGYGYNLTWTGNGTSQTDTDPTFLYSSSYQNKLGGFIFAGAAGSAHNDLQMIDPVSSYDGNTGFEFVRPGANVQINNAFAEYAGKSATGRSSAQTAASHVGHGVNFDTGGSAFSSVTFNGGSFANNSFAGVQVYSNSTVAKLTLNGTTAWGNGQYGSTSGYILQSTTPVTRIIGATAFDGGPATQTNGLSIASSGVNTNTIVAGSDFTGNTVSGCNTVLTNKSVILGSGC